MFYFRFLFLFLFSGDAVLSQNYADELLAGLEAKTAAQLNREDPVGKLLLAEEIYYLGHETSQQQKITELLFQLFEATRHQELKAEIGYILAQQFRQLGQYDRVETLIGNLGYVSEWQVLGPLAPNEAIDPQQVLTGGEVQGMNRSIRPWTIRAYGAEDYWDEGIGQYGFFSANHAIYPNQLAGALFSTWCFFPETGTYRLGLGWSHVAKAWINRTVVFEGSESQRPHPDQAAVYFKMRKGWHRLTLYLQSDGEDPMLGFFARLTDGAGTPLTFRADKQKGWPKRKPNLLDSPEKPLAELASEQSAYALASVLLSKEQQNHSKHGNPLELLARAMEREPSRSVLEKMLTLVEDPNEKWQRLSGFLEGLPASAALDRAWTLTQLGQIALDQQRFWEARQYAGEAMAAHPGFWPAKILENNTFSSLGLDGEALRETESLAQRLPKVPWIMMDLGDLYTSLGFQAESDAVTEDILEIRSGNAKFSERRIKLLKARGDSEALDELYASVLKDAPYSVSLIRSYVQFLIANGRSDKAEALLTRSLEQLPENPFLLESMGELELRMGRANALDYLEKALALRPQNPALEKLIALSKTEQTAFYQPFTMEEPPDFPFTEVSSIGVNFDITVCKVAPNGQSSVFHQIEYEVLTEKGIQELPGYSFSYAPLRQRIEVLKAEVYRGDQTILLTKSGRRRISDPAYRMYYDLVSYQIAFPTLEVGDRIRLEYRIDDVDQTNIFGDYFGDLHYFSSQYPTRHLAYTLILPKNRELHYHVEKMKPQFESKTEGDNAVMTWRLNRISAYETESRMPGLSSYLPYVAVSTFSDWQHMARWYANLIKDQMNLNHETKAIVRDLVEGVTDRLEIVKRIHEYVITHTRYVALEFGIHGYKPYEVNQVCSRQFGDCKDKAVLIISMLREAGVAADIAIVRTSDQGEVHTYPALLAYFNHAIAYVPEFDLYLDGTAEFSGINELPAMDQGALTLIVDDQGKGKLTKIPIGDQNLQGYSLELTVDGEGATKVRGELSYQGVVTPEVRQYLAIESKLNQKLESLLSTMMPGLSVLDANREGKEINDPITLRFEGVSRQLVQVGNGRMKLPLTILNTYLTQAYTPNASRKFPIEFGVPKTKTVQVRVGVPSGYRLAEYPEPLEVEDENFKVRIQVNEERPDQCLIDYRLIFKSPRVEPDDYLSLRSMMQAHDRVLDQAIQFVAR